MSGDELTAHVEGIVHEDTQVGEHGLDLTVAEIHDIEEPGRVDFGGGELEDATTAPHESEKRNADDDYEWWNLDAGQYLVEFNEQVSADEPLCLQTREEVRERGAFHPTLFVREIGARSAVGSDWWHSTQGERPDFDVAVAVSVTPPS